MHRNPTPRPATFDAAVLAYCPALRAYINKSVPAGKREDALQDVLEYIFAHWRNFRISNSAIPYGQGSGFYTWLMWQARGCLKNAAERKRPTLVLIDSYKRYHGQVAPRQEDIVAAGQVIERLADRRGSVVLRRAMGFGLAEIGADMGISKERVRQLEIAGREKLTRQRKRLAA